MRPQVSPTNVTALLLQMKLSSSVPATLTLALASNAGCITAFAPASLRQSRTNAYAPVASRRSTATYASAGSFDNALIFDCDGVLIETEEIHRLAYNSAFDEFDLKIDGEPVEGNVP